MRRVSVPVRVLLVTAVFLSTLILAAPSNLLAQANITFKGHEKEVLSVAFSPDGTQVLTGSADNTAKLWETKTGNLVRTFEGHKDWVTSVAFWPYGRGRQGPTPTPTPTAGWKVLTGSADGTAILWDTQTGKQVGQFSQIINQKVKSPVLSVAFSPDGNQVLTGGADTTAQLWDVLTGKLKFVLAGHKDQVLSVAFSTDGTQVLTGSGDGTAILWDVQTQTGKSLYQFRGHKDQVTSVAFSTDGESVLTGSNDGIAILWDAQTGKELRQFTHPTTGNKDRVTSVAFSPDGNWVLTGSADKTAMRFPRGSVLAK
jgi:WD40 repeat protein